MIDIALVVGLFFISFLAMMGLALGCAAIWKVWSGTNDARIELMRLQGGAPIKAVLRGSLDAKSVVGDSRVNFGVVYNKATKKHETHSALSCEGVLTAYPD